MTSGNRRLFLPIIKFLEQLKSDYCKTGNFRMRLIFANFAIVIQTRKLIFVNIFAHHYNI